MVVVVAAMRAVVLLVIASVVIFMATSTLPGDAADVRSRGTAEGELLAELQAELGLDRPLLIRYADWATRALTGDFGHSVVSGRSVADLVAERLPTTSVLVVSSAVVTVTTTLLLAWLAADGPPAVRLIVTTVISVLASTPQAAFAAVVAVLLSQMWRLVPPVSVAAGGEPVWGTPELLVLPILTVSLPSAAFAAGLLRGAWEDATTQPFVRDARIRGASPVHTAVRYVGPFVAPTAVRILAIVVGSLVTGTALAEVIFGVAGLGELFVTAVATRDTPVVQIVGLAAAAVVIGGMLAADLLAVRSGGSGRARTTA